MINYSEPEEARIPKTRWRLYGFKGEQTLREEGGRERGGKEGRRKGRWGEGEGKEGGERRGGGRHWGREGKYADSREEGAWC